jgi:putative ATPase
MAASVDLPFVALSAVLSGVKDIRETVAQAHSIFQLTQQATVVFVDEVHRFNKGQQDAFLPHVEAGLIVLIGATTENPSFEVNPALLSRTSVYVLKALTELDLNALIDSGMRTDGRNCVFKDDAKAMLIRSADGDARRLLNHLESVLNASTTDTVVTLPFLNSVLSQAIRRFDKGGEAFYDQISALHKSVRGSDPDAALYWFTRMVDGGVDMRYLSRRLIRMASEEVGLADPRALQLCLNAADAYERLGSPEGDLALAQATLYLAVAAKSNAAYVAYKVALKTVQKNGSAPVPMHLRNAPTTLIKQLGHGQNYRYSHDEPHAYSPGQRYLPEDVNELFYQPSDRGLEAKIAEKLAFLKSL